jgi:hypothetical protein
LACQSRSRLGRDKLTVSTVKRVVGITRINPGNRFVEFSKENQAAVFSYDLTLQNATVASFNSILE